MKIYYHADRNSSLRPGQQLFEDHRGLSVFGSEYWSHIQTKPPANASDAVIREYCAEQALRLVGFPWSRSCCLFAAETIDEAIAFARSILPVPDHPIHIYAVFGERASRHDMTWLDYRAEIGLLIDYCCAYWRGEASNHQPSEGPRKPPQWEVLLPLPVKVLHRVATVDLRSSPHPPCNQGPIR